MSPSKGITAEEQLRLKRYNRKISQKSRVGFNMLIRSMGTNAVHQNVMSSICEIENPRGARNAIHACIVLSFIIANNHHSA